MANDSMMIADGQVHIWKSNTPDRPWFPGWVAAHRAKPLSSEGLLAEMDAAGVRRALLILPPWEGYRNEFPISAARAHPDRLAVMGRLAVECPESRSLIDTWLACPGMLGIRLTFHTPQQKPWLTDGTADWLWSAAERAGIPLMILTPGSLPVVDGIAERHPGLRLCIDHLALISGVKDDAAFADLPALLALAKRPNVSVKAGALPCYSSEAFPYPGLHKYIRQVFDAFGPERIFWASDLTRLTSTYRQCIELFTEELSFLSASDKAAIMGGAMCGWLKWSA
jgi:predicted TIM-barrel fold metal-dependent hydrolase